jgi:hypothetical protein
MGIEEAMLAVVAVVVVGEAATECRADLTGGESEEPVLYGDRLPRMDISWYRGEVGLQVLVGKHDLCFFLSMVRMESDKFVCEVGVLGPLIPIRHCADIRRKYQYTQSDGRCRE